MLPKKQGCRCNAGQVESLLKCAGDSERSARLAHIRIKCSLKLPSWRRTKGKPTRDPVNKARRRRTPACAGAALVDTKAAGVDHADAERPSILPPTTIRFQEQGAADPLDAVSLLRKCHLNNAAAAAAR